MTRTTQMGGDQAPAPQQQGQSVPQGRKAPKPTEIQPQQGGDGNDRPTGPGIITDWASI